MYNPRYLDVNFLWEGAGLADQPGDGTGAPSTLTHAHPATHLLKKEAIFIAWDLAVVDEI